MILINLLPHREAARLKRKEAFNAALVASAVFGALLVALIYLAYQSRIADQQARNDVLKSEIKKLEAQIVAGKLHPFTGPVVDQEGKVRVAAGQTISDVDLEKMDYYVQGVASKMPGK